MSNEKKQKAKKQKKLWKLMEPILIQHLNGIEAKQLSQEINPNNAITLYSQDFICEFINQMESKHRLIAFLSNKPLTITRRDPKDANKLCKLTPKQYNIYKQIEQSQNDGILMRRLTQNNPKISKKQITKIISQILEPQNLTSKYKNRRNNQTYYHGTRYPPHIEKKQKEFEKDTDFMDDIFIIIERQIQMCNNINGISRNELFTIIQTSGLLNKKNDLSMEQIETIIQLLLYENKIYFVPKTVPKNDFNKFLTPSKNTYYHLIKGVRNVRYMSMNMENDEIKRKLEEGLKDERCNKKRKLNDSKGLKIKVEYDDFGDGMDVEKDEKEINGDGKEEIKDLKVMKEEFDKMDVKVYGDIKFRYNNWEYKSPFTEIPCQSCPVIDSCCDDGLINPIHCPYLNAWLDI